MRKEGIYLINQIKTKLKILIEENLKGYILLSVVFIAGAALASLQNFQTTEEEIRLYLKDFMQNVISSGTNLSGTFNVSYIGYVKIFALMLLASLTVIGAPVVLIYTLFEGFSFGTVISCLLKTYGVKGVLIFLCSMLPHLIFAVPVCLGYSAYAMKHSVKLITHKNDLRSNILNPILMCVLFLCIISIAALVQGYIEPILIKLIAPQFV